jgi:hypothetical protein
MPSPQRLYRHYSTPDLAAAFATAKKELEECWQSVGGGAKSGTKAVTEAKLRLHEINAEMDFRAGIVTTKKVNMDLTGYK